MTLTIEVTKVSVTSKGDRFDNDFHTIVMNLRVIDNTEEVIKKDFSIDYKKVRGLADEIPNMKTQMKAEIQKYRAEKAILDTLDAEAAKITTTLTAEIK